jgi:hypothetical protein
MLSVSFCGISFCVGFGWNGVEWDLWGGGRGGGPGFGAGQEWLGPSCSGHDILRARGLKNHAQTASGSSANLISMRLVLRERKPSTGGTFPVRDIH